jgi:monoterpene epsilon-lactone hydrolase
MPSWQARAVTWLLQRVMKRRSLAGKIERTRRIIRLVAERDWRLPAPLRRRQSVRFRPAAALGSSAAGGAGAPVSAEWVEPLDTAPVRTLVYLHGGAYLFCSPRTHRGITAFLARHIPARVLVPDYRLAPEHPFPAALEDALACYRWLLAQGTPAREIVFAGDSAGGGLALAALVALRDAGEALPAAAACIAPWTDLAATGQSVLANSQSDAWVYGESVPIGAAAYLGGTPATHPLASPLYADLKGLPSLLIHVSDSELLLDDSVRLAERAIAAGVSVRLKVWPGLPHVWQGFVPWIPEARESLLEIAAFLAGRL